MSESSTFNQLIQKVREGDQEAATRLVKDYEPAIRRLVRLKIRDRRLGTAFDSMDVCQSVMASFFVRAASGQYELDNAKELLNLLAKMAQNKLAMQVRKQQAQKRDHRRLTSESADEHDVAGNASTPSRQISAKELLQQVQRRLSPEERQLVEWRNEGLKWQEIADRLDAKADGVRIKFARAIDRVSEELGIDDGMDD